MLVSESGSKFRHEVLEEDWGQRGNFSSPTQRFSASDQMEKTFKKEGYADDHDLSRARRGEECQDRAVWDRPRMATLLSLAKKEEIQGKWESPWFSL